MEAVRILVIRLSAMGDILHALPAAAALKRGNPGCVLTWAVKPRFRELLDGGGVADEVIAIDRGSYASVRDAAKALRRGPFETVIDFQGLLQSAAVAAAARSSRVFGFDASEVREKAAALFYSDAVKTTASHVVDKNLELAVAAGAREEAVVFPLPTGCAEGVLPEGRFVLAAPFAGWVSKQWPLENYAVVAGRLKDELDVALVLNGAPWQERELRSVAGAEVHVSSVSGLIDATRRAAATLGVDSGPMHLGAALGRPGVALFGPTDPARNGPYGAAVQVMRSPLARTTYKRGAEIDPSMRALDPADVFEALKARL